MDISTRLVDNLSIARGEGVITEIFAKNLEEKLGTQTYQTWFSSAKYAASENDLVLIIYSPNTFISDFIEQNYAQVVTNILYELMFLEQIKYQGS